MNEKLQQRIKLYKKQFEFQDLQEQDVMITYALDPHTIFVQEVGFVRLFN